MYNAEKKFLTYTVKDFYKDYAKAQRKSEFPRRTYKKYKEYILDIFAEIFKEIVKNDWQFVLPYSLGELYLKTSNKVVGQKVIDWGKTQKTGKHHYFFNNHTFGKVYSFVWDKTYARFPTSKYYSFNILTGANKAHEKYGIGARAIKNHIRKVSEDPLMSLPNSYNKPTYKQQDIPNG